MYVTVITFDLRHEPALCEFCLEDLAGVENAKDHLSSCQKAAKTKTKNNLTLDDVFGIEENNFVSKRASLQKTL